MPIVLGKLMYVLLQCERPQNDHCTRPSETIEWISLDMTMVEHWISDVRKFGVRLQSRSRCWANYLATNAEQIKPVRYDDLGIPIPTRLSTYLGLHKHVLVHRKYKEHGTPRHAYANATVKVPRRACSPRTISWAMNSASGAMSMEAHQDIVA